MNASLLSFVLFAGWAIVTLVLFRPFGYVGLALVVAIGTMGAEFIAERSAASPPDLRLSSVAKLAASNALLAAAIVTGLFFLLVIATAITGPAPSYSTPPVILVFIRAFICALLAAMAGLYAMRAVAVRRANNKHVEPLPDA